MTIYDLTNELMLIRRRLGLTRKQVASILGYKATTTIAKIEAGKLLPPLATLLKLEILYQRPLGYLYPNLYAALRKTVHMAQKQVQPRSTPEEEAHA